MTEYKNIRLKITKGPDIEFEGVVVHEYSTQNPNSSKSRWTELRLWQTRGGAWIAESAGMSTEGGERDLREALVIEDPHSDRSEIAAMEFWGWSPAAKALAKRAGWDVIRRVA